MKWEYRIERLPIYRAEKKDDGLLLVEDIKANDVAIHSVLERLGADGWELVAVNTIGGFAKMAGPKGVMLYLKRPVPPA